MKDAIKYDPLIKALRKAILLNPGMKHRLILKAIKTAESKEARKVIREFYKSGFRSLE